MTTAALYIVGIAGVAVLAIVTAFIAVVLGFNMVWPKKTLDKKRLP